MIALHEGIAMAQQDIQQEIEQIASQYELGALRQKYGSQSIGGQLTCRALIFLFPAPFFVVFLIGAFNNAGLWSIPFGIVACITCFWIFAIASDLRKTYRNRYSQRLLYANGFMVVKCLDGRIAAVEAINWRDIAVIWRDVKRYRQGESSRRVDVYMLQYLNGEIFGKTVWENVERLLNSRVSNLESRVSNLSLGEHIEQMVQPYLWPGVIAAYKQGEPVAFGPLIVHTGGIEYQGNLLPWDFFGSLKEDKGQGRLLVMAKDDSQFVGVKRVWALVASERNPRVAYTRPLEPWAVVAYAQIPNLALLQQLVQFVGGNAL
jgi:hypothetical protein